MKTRRLTEEEKKSLYNACLLVARHDEQKAKQYYKSGSVPLADALHLVIELEKRWHRAMDKTFHAEDKLDVIEWAKVVTRKKQKRPRGKKATTLKREDSLRTFLSKNEHLREIGATTLAEYLLRRDTKDPGIEDLRTAGLLKISPRQLSRLLDSVL
jgi:hypothetical protein